MGIHKVDQKSFAYQVLYFFVKIWHDFFFYRKIEISNQDRVPQKGAVIFTPNHQNALMDALALLFGVNRTLVFLARADMFKKNFIAEILYFLRILPVFRPRDGHSEVKRNQDTFDKTTEVLQKNLGLVIFPEGNHGDKHSLRLLKKGFARIAYQTEEGNDYSLNIKIIPMGMLYSNYQNCRSVLSINFGHPFSLSPYYEDYKTNPAIAYNKASEDLSKELKKYMVHIEDDKYYETIDFLQTTYPKQLIGASYQEFSNRILSSQKAISILKKHQNNQQNDFEKLHEKTNDFLRKSKNLNSLQKLQITDWNLSKFIMNVFIFLFCSPAFIVSYAVTLLPVGISLFVTSKIKDTQFQSSIKFVIALLSFPIFYLIEQLIFNNYSSYPWYYFLGLFVLTTVFVSQSAHWIRQFYSQIKLFFLSVFYTTYFNELINMHRKIEEHIFSFSRNN